jgi:hypothetical protein
MAALPPLRPLVLLLKVLLKQASLNEVFSGGLSSWSLINMVVAHLQAEGMAADLQWLPDNARDPGALVGVQQAMQFLEDITHQQEQLEEEKEWVGGEETGGDGGQLRDILAQASAVAVAGRGDRGRLGGGGAERGDGTKQCWDHGCLLLGFLRRYGQLFDLETEAVDVIQGGIVWKGQVDGGLLWLRDPVEASERNVAKGSNRISEVREKFDRAVRQLEDAGAVAAGIPGWPLVAAAAAAGGGEGSRALDTGELAGTVQGGVGEGGEEEVETSLAGDFIGDLSEEMLEGNEEVEDEGVEGEAEEAIAAQFPLLSKVIDVGQGLGYRKSQGGLLQLRRSGKIKPANLRDQRNYKHAQLLKQQQLQMKQQQGKKQKTKPRQAVRLHQQQLQVVGLGGVKLSKNTRRRRNTVLSPVAAAAIPGAAVAGGGGVGLRGRGGGQGERVGRIVGGGELDGGDGRRVGGGGQGGGFPLRECRSCDHAPPLGRTVGIRAAEAAVGVPSWLQQATRAPWQQQQQERQLQQQQQQQQEQQQFGQQLGLPQPGGLGAPWGQQQYQPQQHYRPQQQYHVQPYHHQHVPVHHQQPQKRSQQLQQQYQQPQQPDQLKPPQGWSGYVKLDPPFDLQGNGDYGHHQRQEQQQGQQGVLWSGMHPVRLQQLQQQEERGSYGGPGEARNQQQELQQYQPSLLLGSVGKENKQGRAAQWSPQGVQKEQGQHQKQGQEQHQKQGQEPSWQQQQQEERQPLPQRQQQQQEEQDFGQQLGLPQPGRIGAPWGQHHYQPQQLYRPNQHYQPQQQYRPQHQDKPQQQYKVQPHHQQPVPVHHQQYQQQYQQPQHPDQLQSRGGWSGYVDMDQPLKRHGNGGYGHHQRQEQQQQGQQRVLWSGMHPARLQQLQQQEEGRGAYGGPGAGRSQQQHRPY